MLQLLLAAPSSGSGKTTAACALLSALKARGLEPCAFKCGPDYIDPMFHRAVLGVPSHNLDLFFSTPQTVRRLYTSGAAGHGSAVCEGAMGYYDGLGGVSAAASAWHTADALDLPVLLVVRPKGASLTLAAELQGLKAFRTPHHMAGVLLNDCSEMCTSCWPRCWKRRPACRWWASCRRMPEAAIESRHLGLKTAGEIADLQQKIQILTAAAQKTIDWPLLHALFDRPAPCRVPCTVPPHAVRIAVAQDAAFCFTYAETLEACRKTARSCAFSARCGSRACRNYRRAVPAGRLPGAVRRPAGREHRHARRRKKRCAGRPAHRGRVRRLFVPGPDDGQDADGNAHPMAGVLPGQGFKVGRLVRFGYARLTARADSMLFRAGETLPVHEFHHWDSTANGDAFTAAKANGRQWACGFANARLYAGFRISTGRARRCRSALTAASRTYIKETS